MPLYKQVVFNNPVDGRDKEFNEWYDTMHMEDTLAMPGFRNGQRFKLTGDLHGRGFSWRYSAHYDVAAERPQTIVDEIVSRRGTPAMRVTGVSDYQNLGLCFFEPVTDRTGAQPNDLGHRLFELSNPTPGREAEYLDWCKNTHVPFVADYVGAATAQLFRLAHAASPDRTPWRYLAIYDVDAGRIDNLVANLRSGAAEATPTSSAHDVDSYAANVLRPLAAVVQKERD